MASPTRLGQDDFFPTTRWTLVVTAGDDAASDAERALNELFQTYRRPLLRYLERHLPSRQDAEDLVQEFLVRMLRRRAWVDADPSCGRFRQFLMHDLKLFLKEQHRHKTRQRRGGGVIHLSLDCLDDGRVEAVVPPPDAAESVFDRAWAEEVLTRAVQKLRRDYTTPNKSQLFDLLQPHLDRRGSSEFYRSVGILTDRSEEAVARQFSEMKERLRFHLTALVQDTVRHPADVPDELNFLFRALGSGPS